MTTVSIQGTTLVCIKRFHYDGLVAVMRLKEITHLLKLSVSETISDTIGAQPSAGDGAEINGTLALQSSGA